MKYRLGLLALLAGLLGEAQAETWQFALIGDVPYSVRERRELPRMLAAISDAGSQVVLHIGDIKSGAERCDDALYSDRYQLFDASRTPFVYVPGDNEWSDCDRLSNGPYDPQERLEHLRRVFYRDNLSLGQQRLPLQRQSAAFPEHSRFRLGPVLFATLNIPGGNNNFGNAYATEASAEYRGRMPHVLAWIEETYAQARRDKLAGVVLLFQADPDFAHLTSGLPHRGFREFFAAVRREAAGFPGQTVLVHGDTHWSRIDHPLRDASGKVMNQVSRVETFGYPIMGWTRGIIDSDDPAFFRFSTQPWKAEP